MKRARLSTSLDELLLRSSPDDLLKKSKKLGEGGYGMVFAPNEEEAEEDTVIKVSPLQPSLLGCPYTSPFRSEHVEPRMLEFLWHMVLAPGTITPHILAPRGANDYALMRDSGEVTFLMQRAEHDTITSYLSKVGSNGEFNRELRIMLFQICYTLEVLYRMFPGFRHGDLGEGNVLIASSPTPPPNKEDVKVYSIGSRVFHVPSLPVIPLLSDFDYACIPGMGLDNYKVLEMQLSEPHLRIGTMRDEGADLHRLIYQLSYVFEDTSYNLRSKRDWGKRGLVMGNLELTPADLLFDSHVFDDFLASPPHARGHIDYACPAQVPVPVDASLTLLAAADRYPERRECPLFLSSRFGGTRTTEIFLSRHMQPTESVAVLDREPATAYCEHEMGRIETLFYRDFDLVRAYPLGGAGARENIRARFQAFIESRAVPHRWWYFAYTCAFTDYAYTQRRQMLDHKGQVWTIEDWVTRWNEVTGIGTFTNMQFLHFLLQWSLFFSPENYSPCETNPPPHSYSPSKRME